MATCPVLYVHPQDAKVVKTRLQNASFLDRRFRMTRVSMENVRCVYATDDEHQVDECEDDDIVIHCFGSNGGSVDRNDMKHCIAVPIIDGCIEKLQHHINASTSISVPDAIDDDIFLWLQFNCIGYGEFKCPFSTSMLGNNNNISIKHSRNVKQKAHKLSPTTNEQTLPALTNVQYALIETISNWASQNNQGNNDVDRIESMVRALNNQTCPKKLEIIGDDKTLVIPSWSFFIAKSMDEKDLASNANDVPKMMGSSEFRELLMSVIRGNCRVDGDIDQEESADCTEGLCYASFINEMQSQLWKNLATLYNSQRVVRRGDIDPESGVRESGHRILYPIPLADEAKTNSGDFGYLPTQTGPNSPGWITVTEHGIHQSFDLTRVMFSRGNVTEKKRFGSLVQPGECVLDMYAGIGYYTLPALIHGKAAHVTACEWNEHALYALKYNLKANGVDDKVTVLEGDCRVSLKRLLDEQQQSASINGFDRISLGLLPSSEGGWAIAVSCLCQSTGGWLHVHANVPTVERMGWTHWLCRSLAELATADSCWIAVCTHVEKVKSFAPKVDHVVADVFVGPSSSPKLNSTKGMDGCLETTGVIDSSGKFVPTPLNVAPPSCALNEEGILHQHWMRRES